MFQIEASVQPGNSGRPLSWTTDQGMHVIGVVNSRLNDLAMVEAASAESIPQNRQLTAIKARRIPQIFLDANKIPFPITSDDRFQKSSQPSANV